MRTVSAPLLAALTSTPRRAAECVVLQARDGTVAGFTTWSHAVTIDLSGDGGPGPVECAPRATLSATTLATGFDASNFELTIARSRAGSGGQFTRAKVLGGKWRHAMAWQVRVSPGVAGYAPIMRGRVFGGRVKGAQVILEVRDAAAYFNISQGNVLQPWCRARFGDASTGCPVVPEPVECTVTAVEKSFVFAVDQEGVFADNHFFLGTVAFQTGELAGTDEIKVFAFDGTTAGIELFEPPIQAPDVGDTLLLTVGCSKLLKSANPTIPTCVGYGAAVDFRGEPELPGNRTLQRVMAPGTNYE